MNDLEWNKLKSEYSRSNAVVLTDQGSIDFSLSGYKKTEFNGHPVTYDEYLDLQRSTGGNERPYFASCYFNSGSSAECRGEIAGIRNDRILFHRIFVTGMYADGTFFDGKEDHVWMHRDGFEKYHVGDKVSFFAEVYRYLKTGNGKKLDYGLRNPEEIEQIGDYALPSKDALLKQDLRALVCETCMYADHCYGDPCLAPTGYRENMIKKLSHYLQG